MFAFFIFHWNSEELAKVISLTFIQALLQSFDLQKTEKHF